MLLLYLLIRFEQILYLTNRQGSYHFRRIVPLGLRAIIGSREMIRSLETHDFKTARKTVIEMAHVD